MARSSFLLASSRGQSSSSDGPLLDVANQTSGKPTSSVRAHVYVRTVWANGTPSPLWNLKVFSTTAWEGLDAMEDTAGCSADPHPSRVSTPGPKRLTLSRSCLTCATVPSVLHTPTPLASRTKPISTSRPTKPPRACLIILVRRCWGWSGGSPPISATPGELVRRCPVERTKRTSKNAPMD
ncbi:hypothetical protein OF83DRAFT_645147 [Amylostereum chailletii]|nr:hypothetical protein OF83DRAFT_645147 [Amylostereum chailletii]